MEKASEAEVTLKEGVSVVLVYVGHNLARRVVGLGLRGEILYHLFII